MALDSYEHLEELTVNWDAGIISVGQGAALRYTTYRAARPDRGHLIILPDVGEFAEKYSELAEEMASHGWQLSVLEWRGMDLPTTAFGGRSQHHPDIFALGSRDLQSVWNTTLAPVAVQTPFVFMGHGLGAHLLLRWHLADTGRQHWPDGLVLSSLTAAPLLAPMTTVGAWVIGMVLYALGLNAEYPGRDQRRLESSTFEGNPYTSDLQRFSFWQRWLKIRHEKYERLLLWQEQIDARFSVARIWLSLWTGGQGLLRVFWRYVRNLRVIGGQGRSAVLKQYRSVWQVSRLACMPSVPTLVLGNPDDPLGGWRLQSAIQRQLPGARMALIRQARHDLFQETDQVRDVAMQALLGFLDDVADSRTSRTA